MSLYPRCPDCEADMQLVDGEWRCPWTTARRGRRSYGRRLCGWAPGRMRGAVVFERSVGR
jgi:hypothetical protein